jgi:hypothetical protein
MGPWAGPPDDEARKRKAAAFVRGGCASLLVASVVAMLSGVAFIQYDLPLWFLREGRLQVDAVRLYYEHIGTWTLAYVLLTIGIAGLFVGVHALSHEVSIYTMAYASIMMPIGFIAFANLGLIVSLASLVAIALFGEAWRLQPSNGGLARRPSPYGAPAPGERGATSDVGPPMMDMEGRSPAVLVRPVATLILAGSVAVIMMFTPNYPTYNLSSWHQWFLYSVLILGLSCAALAAFRRLWGLVLLSAVLALVAAILDIDILLEMWYHQYDLMPWTFLIAGPSSLLAIVYIVTARDVFVPARETLTSRSSPSPSWPRPR